jgi:hypothetical protein
MALLASLHCNFQPEVVAYLRRRHRNETSPTEELPKCPVTTGLLIALHLTAQGKNDVANCVLAMDTHQWITVPHMASPEEQAAAVKRCRCSMNSRLKDRLAKAVGKGGRDRAKMARKDSDQAETSKCLNRLLTETYVPIPDKKRKRKKQYGDTAATFSSDSSSLSSSSSSALPIEASAAVGGGTWVLPLLLAADSVV